MSRAPLEYFPNLATHGSSFFVLPVKEVSNDGHKRPPPSPIAAHTLFPYPRLLAPKPKEESFFAA